MALTSGAGHIYFKIKGYSVFIFVEEVHFVGKPCPDGRRYAHDDDFIGHQAGVQYRF
jgi:hypothetical protein